MNENLVAFKGNKEGIYIHIKDGNFKAIKEQLELKLKETKDFFAGSDRINFVGKNLTINEKEELKIIIEQKYGIAVNDKKSLEIKGRIDPKSSIQDGFFSGIEEGETRFIRSTVRSGQYIEYEGNLIVIGDINPGGQVVAKGNIVVMGSLRGIAHAGSDGNRKAIVAAFNLQPTQLRIAEIIARRPDSENYVNASKWPEVARIEGNAVLIEPYSTKK
ncbi:septum site-determining protein MinC [Sporosalibacterium faouarense]|uniref:septum site-determining protein MinC n=1 Tax=Sporosalibacterium faouarense TaxID=516123 RepID=UPI00141D3913|nr:septum site-determining protein MinC [Sporosalibacterium faouarense]MTI48510.1 septum site-determining protein MinC [Bacillota bacterium]